MNLNKGCIEISIRKQLLQKVTKMNLNKGCIEIYINTPFLNIFFR